MVSNDLTDKSANKPSDFELEYNYLLMEISFVRVDH